VLDCACMRISFFSLNKGTLLLLGA